MNSDNTFLYLCVGFLVSLFGIAYKLLLDRMGKQEERAAADTAALRVEISTTKQDAQAALTRQEAQASAAASVLRDSVASTAKAAKEGVDASAKALSDSVIATAKTAKDAVDASAATLEKKIEEIAHRVEKMEDRSFSKTSRL